MYFKGSEFKGIDVKLAFKVFCLRVYKLILCSALNFQKGDCSWFLKWGVWGYFSIMFVLKQNGSYSGIILIYSVNLFLGFGGILELSNIFFKNGSSLKIDDFYFDYYLVFGGAFMIKSSSKSFIKIMVRHHRHRREWHSSCWRQKWPSLWLWWVSEGHKIIQFT